MPTGYTAELMDKGQDFRTFTLTCARAFGACIMQRDDPMKELPAKQEPSDYHVKALKEARDTLKRLRGMTPKQQQTHGEQMRSKAVASARQMLISEQEQNSRLDRMATQVKAWTPPTKDHEGLKAFMLEQIQISRHDLAWAEKYVREAEEKTPEAYFVEAVSGAVRNVAYHEKGQREEQDRVDGRNEWIEKLYESLPS